MQRNNKLKILQVPSQASLEVVQTLANYKRNHEVSREVADERYKKALVAAEAHLTSCANSASLFETEQDSVEKHIANLKVSKAQQAFDRLTEGSEAWKKGLDSSVLNASSFRIRRGKGSDQIHAIRATDSFGSRSCPAG